NSIEIWPTDQTLVNEVYKYFNHYYPSMRDIYNVSVSGQNCSFFLNDNAEWVILTEEKNIKINSIGNKEFPDGFKIIMPDGIQYIFDQKEFTQQMSTSIPGK